MFITLIFVIESIKNKLKVMMMMMIESIYATYSAINEQIIKLKITHTFVKLMLPSTIQSSGTNDTIDLIKSCEVWP